MIFTGNCESVHNLVIVILGVGVGVMFGAFGAGGSAFATPLLALVGVPGVIAVASPLPALFPAAMANARRTWRGGHLDRRLAMLAVLGGAPGAMIGSIASGFVSGRVLLVLSGVVLVVVGVRMFMPSTRTEAASTEAGAGAFAGATDGTAATTEKASVVLAYTFAVGLMTGLLANGGGFLLVPLFVLILGLGTRTASGTSMVAVGLLTIPTLLVHASLGHIDWKLALIFAIGVIPGSFLGSKLADRLPEELARRSFAAVLVVFSVGFVATRLL